MQTLITVIHIFTCVLIVLLVLIQSGKGAEISTSFAGSSQTVFGSSGGANFFTRLTSGAAAVFMTTSLTLTLLGGASKKSLFESMSGDAGRAAAASPKATATQVPAAGSSPTTTQTSSPAK